MAELRLGPLLRHVDADTGTSATIWIEADQPREAAVRTPTGAAGSARTWQVAGHHYALIPVTGLTPGTDTPYEITLDGEQVWPPPGSPMPPSVIRTPHAEGPVRVAFGSCRWAAKPAGGEDPVGPDALDTLAQVLAADPAAERPDVLLLLGDQVYADETSAAIREQLAARRDLDDPDGPGAQIADYEEYTLLYYESWLDPEVRWLLSTVPSCMIFDDHDLIDDWNTSAAWQSEIRRRPWWQERVVGGLMSYWVHQHLGNLSPAELAADRLYKAVQAADDATDLVRDFALRADTEPATVRWSYRRDFGRVRLLMADTRGARVLDEERRAMINDAEFGWLREQALDAPDSYDHLLVGSSLPWLLPPAIHDAEAWNAALCLGGRGPRWARIGERMRQAGDLEHWAAFPSSFTALTELITEVGRGPHAPATVSVLSGDVHHAYVSEPRWAEPVRSRVAQLTCSPMHNSIPAAIRAGFRFGWSRGGRALGRLLARHGRVGRPPVDWNRTGGPWFGNQLMTLTLHGRDRARLRLDQAEAARGGTRGVRLVTADERELA
ncbi:alkaline phosphatase D family protein [Streptomyces sp. NPDC051940]|uniref:alkaline phosphatase D family protein n=1 Tax=Streptomyces sp. NPDC051940 TaxID=3155675 RepID=UPI003443D2FD